MHHTEIQALRRLLFLSIAEAARWIPADAERPRGVEERTWSRWESGQRPVPPNVAEALQSLVGWRDVMLDELRAAAGQAEDSGAPLVVLWYEHADDWPEQGLFWRPAQSLTAQVLAEAPAGTVRLVPFDPAAYRAWRLAHQVDDSGAARERWAQAVAASTPTPPVLSGGGTPPVLSGRSAMFIAQDDGPGWHGGTAPKVLGVDMAAGPDRAATVIAGHGQQLAPVVIPEGLDFAELKMARDSATGDVSFDWGPIERICEASNLALELFTRGPEDNVAGLVTAFYQEHLARGGAPDPVQEDLIAEADAEDAHGGGFSHPPGRA